ncbi:MAG: hypothetical protein MJ188_00315 [Treponema sp.]|nr:hypothetical protein [Treponema sp.]
MKKSVRGLLGLLFVSAMFCFSGCLADAVPDDGSGFINKPGTSGNGASGGTGGTGWGLCKNHSYDIFDIQVWGDGAGTFDYENKADSGKFIVLSKGGGWVGGGLIAADSTKYIDFSGVSKMKFEIRGRIDTKALCLAVQNNGGASATMYPGKKSIASAGVTSLSETDWKTVEMNVSGASKDNIINAFCLIVAGDWGGSFSANDWFEIRNLDYEDAEGKSVILKLK